jgi:hypothetical protein
MQRMKQGGQYTLHKWRCTLRVNVVYTKDQGLYLKIMNCRVLCDTLVNSTHTKASVNVLEAAEKMLILAEILRIFSVELIIV